MEPERHYTVREVAQHLHCTEKTVRRYIKEGSLSAKTSVRPNLVSASDLQRFLDSLAGT